MKNKITIQEITQSHNRIYSRATTKLRKWLIYEATLELIMETQKSN